MEVQRKSKKRDAIGEDKETRARGGTNGCHQRIQHVNTIKSKLKDTVDPTEKQRVSIRTDSNKNKTNGDGRTSENPDIKPGIFYIDYSVRGTAKCNKCNKCIPKNELRISKPAMYKKKEIKKSYHVACIFESFKKVRHAKNIITSVEQIIGFDIIKPEEQLDISQLVAQMKPICEQLQARNISAMPNSAESTGKSSAKIKIKDLVCSERDSLKVLYTNADQLTSKKLSELKYKIL